MLTSLFAFSLFTAVLSKPHREEAPPVAVDLYYETLCPYSREYFNDQLYPTWLEMSDIMDVHLYPFGNAEYHARPNNTGYIFTCQHGRDECKGNMIHACAQKIFNDIYVEMDFVNCLLSASYPPDAGPECAAAVNKDWAPIDLCINTVEGENLLHDVALIQEQLNPSLYFVPWIVVDGYWSQTQNSACQTNQHWVVCHKYTGTPPASCAGNRTTLSLNRGRSSKN